MVFRFSISRPALSLRHNVQVQSRLRSSAISSTPLSITSHYARHYAKYSRFGDEEGRGQGDGRPNSDENHKRKNELYQMYGSMALVGGAGGIWYVTHLEKVPETQRWRYMDVSKRMVKMLEDQSYTELMQEFGNKILPMNDRATRFVQRVAEKLITKNGLGHVVTRPIQSKEDQKQDEWLVYVVNEEIANAFVMPGRKIVVFTGMLKQVADEDQLAGILAHEVAHQLVGHVLEKVSLSRLLVFVDAAVQILLGTNTALGTLALQFLVGLPNSRTQELEADLVGLRLMSKACFEPGAVVEFWKSFEKSDKSQVPQFLSTHPGHKQRATAIEGWVPGIRAQYPCADLTGFMESFNGYNSSSNVEDVRKPAEAFTTGSQNLEPSAPQSQQQPHQTQTRNRPRLPPTPGRPSPLPPPSSSPKPDASDWGTNDPYGTSAGSGDTADWGTQDPWTSKNGGGGGGSGGIGGSSNKRW